MLLLDFSACEDRAPAALALLTHPRGLVGIQLPPQDLEVHLGSERAGGEGHCCALSARPPQMHMLTCCPPPWPPKQLVPFHLRRTRRGGGLTRWRVCGAVVLGVPRLQKMGMNSSV